MADVEDKIIVKNLQVEYSKLSNDILEKSTELSSILEKGKLDRKLTADKKKEALLTIQEREAESNIIHANLEARNIELQESTALLQTQFEQLESNIKQKTKDLIRVNGQVLAAEAEYERYLTVIGDIDKAKEELQSNINLRDECIKQFVLIDEQRNAVLLDISTKQSESEGILKAARDELSQLVYLSEQKKKEALQAEDRVKTYTDELYAHMNDYQIVKARLENVWSKTFPELELPL